MRSLFASLTCILSTVSLLAAANAPVVQATTTTTTTTTQAVVLPDSRVIVSIRDQKLMLLRNNVKVAIFPVSTSKYGMGDFWGRMTTPLGNLQVAQKIGDGAPLGAVFHNRRWTGEVLRPNAPGRDPITTRIIWLRGLETQNAHAYNRCIYIHGTNEEKLVGQPASFGCIRMKSNDVASLFGQLPLGAIVQITPERLPHGAGKDREEIISTRMAPPQPKGMLITASGGRGGA